MDGHVVVLARHGERHLPLEIEVLLPADVHAPFEHMRRGRDGGLGIATLHRVRRLQEGLRLHGLIDREIGGPVLVLDDGQAGGGARLGHRIGGDGEQRLPVVFDQAVGEHGIVARRTGSRR